MPPASEIRLDGLPGSGCPPVPVTPPPEPLEPPEPVVPEPPVAPDPDVPEEPEICPEQPTARRVASAHERGIGPVRKRRRTEMFFPLVAIDGDSGETRQWNSSLATGPIV